MFAHQYGLAAAACVAVALGAAPALAQKSQNWEWCENKNNAFSADLGINGCTAVIQSGRESKRNLAIAFSNRCSLLNDKKEYDRALADCNQAIQIDPKFARSYLNRGIAYRGKGDNDRAIEELSLIHI